jgi:hypothetical protein
MKKSILLLISILIACSIATQTPAPGKLLGSVQLVAGGRNYTVSAMGIPDAMFSVFSTDVVVTLLPDGASQPVASIAAGEEDEPIIVTLEAVHIVPGDDQQLAANIHSGGNDIAASCSASYYAIHDGQPALLLKIEWGDPRTTDIDGDGVQEIVTEAEYWGQYLCHADCIPYLDAIYGWDAGKIVKRTAEYKKFIRLEESVFAQYDETRAHIQEQGKSYENLSDEDHLDIFRASVAVLLAYRDSWLRDEATEWWQANAGFLSNVMDVGHYGEILLELEPGKGRLWNGEDYTLVR